MAIQLQQCPEENLCFPLPYSQDWMETGGFCHLYQSLQQQSQAPQQRNQVPVFNGQVSSSDNLVSMVLYHSAEKQRQEIDRLLALQNEELRTFLQEQRKQQLVVFIKRLEANAQLLLRQKELDIETENRKKAELEDCLRRIEMDNQYWQKIAKENELMALALNNTLEEMMRERVCSSSAAAESCCEFCRALNTSDDKEKERRGEKKMMMTCKVCNSREASILILPCRHLCSCKACEAFLDFCPVCNSVKKASIEVVM